MIPHADGFRAVASPSHGQFESFRSRTRAIEDAERAAFGDDGVGHSGGPTGELGQDLIRPLTRRNRPTTRQNGESPRGGARSGGRVKVAGVSSGPWRAVASLGVMPFVVRTISRRGIDETRVLENRYSRSPKPSRAYLLDRVLKCDQRASSSDVFVRHPTSFREGSPHRRHGSARGPRSVTHVPEAPAFSLRGRYRLAWIAPPLALRRHGIVPQRRWDWTVRAATRTVVTDRATRGNGSPASSRRGSASTSPG